MHKLYFRKAKIEISGDIQERVVILEDISLGIANPGVFLNIETGGLLGKMIEIGLIPGPCGRRLD